MIEKINQWLCFSGFAKKSYEVSKRINDLKGSLLASSCARLFFRYDS